MFAASLYKRDILSSIEPDNMVADIDDNLDDPQLCATEACDIYKHLRASEVGFKIPFCVYK